MRIITILIDYIKHHMIINKEMNIKLLTGNGWCEYSIYAFLDEEYLDISILISNPNESMFKILVKK